jgi:hypothetical protein
MPIIRMRVADISIKSGQYLTDLLKARKIEVVYGNEAQAEATVCYGWGFKKPVGNMLNATAGTLDNLQQVERLSNAGIRVVPVISDIKKADFSKIEFPLLARTERHEGGGTDIMPVFQQEEIPWRQAAGAKFFTQYIPRKVEYRLWIYRRRLLAAYVKEMVNPEKYKGIGCNYKDGFEHEFIERKDIPAAYIEMAAKAVFSMGLDFGGVDILVSKSNVPYVLEVNTAPGANGPKAVGITKLADSIANWIKLGYPKQNSKFSMEDEG